MISEWERHGSFGVLTISNPPQNYLRQFKLAHLSDLKRWTEDDTLKGLVVQGKGRHFCAGFDKDDLFSMADEQSLLDELRRSNEILYYLDELPIPVVAAISGVCFGGGLELALSCDIRVCSEKALLSFPEAGIGILPGFNGTFRLPRQVGLARAMEIVLECKVVHAEEALELGLVEYVVPRKEVSSFALDLLEKIAGNRSASGIRAIMQSLNNTRKMPMAAATKRETELFAGLALSQFEGNPAQTE